MPNLLRIPAPLSCRVPAPLSLREEFVSYPRLLVGICPRVPAPAGKTAILTSVA
jgi:hypothetical protein